MSCNTCTKKFGLLVKELGCPECGFSYCKKCLKYEAKDPNKEDGTRYVCSKCHLKHVQMEPPLEPMDEFARKFRKCIETMCESDDKVKFDFKDRKGKFSSVREGFDHETEKLQARLEALEEDHKKNKPKLKTEEELSQWLDKIQDKPSSSKRPSDAYHPPDRRTETEHADQLMQQFIEETEIDEEIPKPELELEERLARLRGGPVVRPSKEGADASSSRKNLQRSVETESQTSSKKPTKGIWGLDLPSSMPSEDDDELAAQAIIKKALLDAELEKLNVSGDEELEENEDEDLESKKFPWCVICNEDATVKCLECEDLYCNSCFTECCKPEDHLSEPFQSEPLQSETPEA
ncbi:abscission/NoCut checkpoint regulator [Ischnura elegans]|uniref:abscission/NoCut checkpoint regulator n=1 Tax=Ischnura elegans TaxID=197161 RepID=UPI001ED89689|nr:abscission/NoCut checkpoint regulator [Ischnura elegans]